MHKHSNKYAQGNIIYYTCKYFLIVDALSLRMPFNHQSRFTHYDLTMSHVCLADIEHLAVVYQPRMTTISRISPLFRIGHLQVLTVGLGRTVSALWVVQEGDVKVKGRCKRSNTSAISSRRSEALLSRYLFWSYLLVTGVKT